MFILQTDIPILLIFVDNGNRLPSVGRIVYSYQVNTISVLNINLNGFTWVYFSVMPD